MNGKDILGKFASVPGRKLSPGMAVARLGPAGGFDVVDAEEGEASADKFEEGAAFAEEEDAEGGSGDGEEVGKRGELGGFEVAEEPEVEEVGQRRAEQRGIENARVGLPRNRTPDVAKVFPLPLTRQRIVWLEMLHR